MTYCANCRRQLPDDPNEADQIVECRYCDAILCSEDCADEHGQAAHAEEAIPLPDEEAGRP